ncbi:MAG: DNA translocase FtsK 4TM domain-containing protein, partial [Hespellia sp.]|nr:DNA translocase FtsK 4TM domain-containing protein [Hespellia sp.]
MAAKQTKRTSKGKSNTKSKTSTKPRSSSKKTQTANNALYDEIALVITFAVCVLLLISNFGIGGSIGNTVSSVFFGIFGLLAYIMPIVLFGGISFLIINKENSHAYIKGAAGVTAVFSLSTFIELVVNSYDANASWLSYYTQASIHKNAGGLVGGCLVKIFCPLIGVVGTFIVVITLIIISAIIITEKSFLSFLHRSGKRVYDDSRQRKNEADLKRTERKKEAAKNDALKGVSFDTTLSRKSPELKELEPPKEQPEFQPANESKTPSKGFGFVIERPENIPEAPAEIPEPENKEPARRTRKKKPPSDASVVAAEVAD